MARDALWILPGALVLAACGAWAPEAADPTRRDVPPTSSVDTRNAADRVGRTSPSGGSGSTSYLLQPQPALAVLPAAAALDPKHAYTLAELIDIAQSQNPETRVAWAIARNAALASGVAASTYLPRVTASVVGGYQHSHGRSSAEGVDVKGDSTATGAISVVSLEWLLFDFGERSAVVESSEHLAVASNVGFTAAHQRIIYTVCLAYYSHAATLVRIEVADSSLENALEIEAAADQRYRSGIGTVIEVAHARQATAHARLAQVHAHGSAQNAYVDLVAALGVSPLTRIEVAPVPKRKLSRSTSESIDHIVSEALARRPDMQSAYAASRASQASIKAAAADFKPKLFLAATGAYNSGHVAVTAIPPVSQQPPTLNIAGRHWGSTVLLGLTVPLYDAGTRQNVLQQAYAGSEKATATLERVRDEAVRQVVVARNAVETSLAAYEATTALESAAQVTFDAALDAYRHGVGSITEATAAQTQLLQTRGAAAEAYSTALAAAATLAFSTGSLGSAPE